MYKSALRFAGPDFLLTFTHIFAFFLFAFKRSILHGCKWLLSIFLMLLMCFVFRFIPLLALPPFANLNITNFLAYYAHHFNYLFKLVYSFLFCDAGVVYGSKLVAIMNCSTSLANCRTNGCVLDTLQILICTPMDCASLMLFQVWILKNLTYLSKWKILCLKTILLLYFRVLVSLQFDREMKGNRLTIFNLYFNLQALHLDLTETKKVSILWPARLTCLPWVNMHMMTILLCKTTLLLNCWVLVSFKFNREMKGEPFNNF